MGKSASTGRMMVRMSKNVWMEEAEIASVVKKGGIEVTKPVPVPEPEPVELDNKEVEVEILEP